MEMNKELLVKAKSAKSLEELITIAKENGMELTKESAQAYFKLLNQQTGEIADEELDNVSGGACYNGGRMVVTAAHACDLFECNKCGGKAYSKWYGPICDNCGAIACCDKCKYCIYTKGLWLCTNENNCK